MIFVNINRKINTRKALDKAYMLLFFNKRKQKFLLKSEELRDIHIDLVRNFRGKFRNMSLKYELTTNKGRKIVRAKIHKHQDTPHREWSVINLFVQHGLKKYVPKILDYYKALNLFFYEEAPGTSFEDLLSKSPQAHVRFTPLIAQFLKKVHSISRKPNFLPVKTKKQELKERRHWFFLARKCAPQFYPLFSELLKKLWEFRQETEADLSIVHGDFHWGNILKIKNQKSKIKNNFKVIDFGYSFLGDPLEDVGGFLAQTDSMFHYYAPDFISNADIIRNKFIQNYFGNLVSKKQEKRLLYFEIQKILEMASIVAFVEPNPQSKTKGIERLLKRAKEKLKLL